MKTKFLDWNFDYVGLIEPFKNSDGIVEEFMPQSSYKNAATTKLHDYGAGPFCKFKIASGYKVAGLYVITLDRNPVYVGECENLEKRFNSSGYGGISPRNCFKGGQSTNCRLNNKILLEAKKGAKVELWFCANSEEYPERLNLERILISELDPNWNLAKKNG